MKSMYATFLLAVNVWTELKQQIYWLIQQNQIREFDMHMIKCTRNEFCFEYINTYIKNELFVKIELLTGKKIPWHHIVIKVWKFRKKLFKGITLTYNLWIRNQDHDHWIFLSNKQFMCWINGKKSKQKKKVTTRIYTQVCDLDLAIQLNKFKIIENPFNSISLLVRFEQEE